MSRSIRSNKHWKTIATALDRAPEEALDAVIKADKWCRHEYTDKYGHKCLVSWMLVGMGQTIVDYGNLPSDGTHWHELQQHIGMSPGAVAAAFDALTCTCPFCGGVSLDRLVAEIKSYIAEKRNPQITTVAEEAEPVAVGAEQ